MIAAACRPFSRGRTPHRIRLTGPSATIFFQWHQAAFFSRSETHLPMRALAAGIAATSAAILLSSAHSILSRIAKGRQSATAQRISVIPDETQRRVEIIIDGKPFTSYIWPGRLAKPVLYPVRTANGILITRGFPLDPRPGERVDHPHHVGMWFNYGNVNGFDFWNNSEAIKPEDAPQMGNIRHRAITLAKSGADACELEIDAEWISGKQQLLLKEHTRFIFR